jgi:Protein of unknown function (DUF3306)
MSDDETFFARWSRRKRDAAARPREPDKPAPAAHRVETPAPEARVPGELSLPPIDSIHAASDLRPFLDARVPIELTRAALRRAWTTDPDIRDFVGLSENAWDFNAPDGVPGFGSVTPDDVRRLLADLTEPSGGVNRMTEGSPERVAAPRADTSATPKRADEPMSGAPDHHETHEELSGMSSPRRRHGGALPT